MPVGRRGLLAPAVEPRIRRNWGIGVRSASEGILPELAEVMEPEAARVLLECLAYEVMFRRGVRSEWRLWRGVCGIGPEGAVSGFLRRGME